MISNILPLLAWVCMAMSYNPCPTPPEIVVADKKLLTTFTKRANIYALYINNTIYYNIKYIDSINKDITIVHELVHHVQLHRDKKQPTTYCELMASEVEAYNIQALYEAKVNRRIEDNARLRAVVDNAMCQMGNPTW